MEEDWCDCDPDEFLRDRCQEAPFLADAHYYFVGATLSPGPVGSIPFEVDNGHELTGLTHLDLLNHPAVYEQLGWVTRAPRRRQLEVSNTG